MQGSYENNSAFDTNRLPLARSRQSNGRKRNKPTLSCNACVGRKTKCDRARPTCLACCRRQCACEYSILANAITVTDALYPRKRRRKLNQTLPAGDQPSTTPASRSWTSPSRTSQLGTFGNTSSVPSPAAVEDSSSDGPTPASQKTNTRHPHDRPRLFNLFGMTTQHPFRNLWTDAGGLTEVIAVLPTKEEADLLVQKYFEIIDAIYPIIPPDTFLEEYQKFWSASQEGKQLCDPAHLALQFAMYAMGVQYFETLSPAAKETSSLFYLSCCHQCLCISSYLNRCSLVTLQTMVLITLFLVASHRISEAWTFSGVGQRQAYGLQLHQDPMLVAPDAPSWQHQVRSRLWLATMFQDTSLSLYLELPPGTMNYEIQPNCIEQFTEPPNSIWMPDILHESSRPLPSDISYLRAMWQYTQFVQECMCVKKSLKPSISGDAANKVQLISRLRELYLNFDPPFNSYDQSRFENQPQRLTRQLVSLNSNFFYGLTILYMDNDENAGVECDVYGALDASHEAMASFFALARLFSGEADAWGAPQMRAYTQASMIATILADLANPSEHGPRDPHLMLAKCNLDRYIDILIRARGSDDFDTIRQKRLGDLQTLRDKITVV